MNENQTEKVSYKPFDLEECMTKYGGRCITRDGRPARIICTDRKVRPGDETLVSLVFEPASQMEFVMMSYESGVYVEGAPESSSDLFLPVKLDTGFIVVSKGTRVYETFVEAEQAREMTDLSERNTVFQIVMESPLF